MNDINSTIGIPEILISLREDLDKAQASLSETGNQPLLMLDSAEVELTVSLTHSSGKDGKAGFNVLGVNLGVGDKEDKIAQNTHKVKICLKPIRSVGVAG